MSDYTVGDTLHFMFTTRRFTTGAPFTLAGTPAVSVYEDAGTTEITAGITLGVDHDARTGLNLVTIVASGANGYESGKDYHLVVTAGTVDSVSVVGEMVGRFTLQKSAAAVDLANGTDGLTAIMAALTIIDDFLDSEIAAILTDTGTDIPASIAALNNLSAAQVNAEVVDALATDTYAEPTGVPAATATLAAKLGTLYMVLRNRVDVTSTKMTFYDDGGAAEFEKDLSDDGTTYSESEANAI